MSIYSNCTVSEAAREELSKAFVVAISKLTARQTADRVVQLINCKPGISAEELMGSFISLVDSKLWMDYES
jgi:hypothetical protein